MIKAFKLVPFTKTKEEIPLNGKIFYVDIEENQSYWKDVIIISSKNLDELTEIHTNLKQLKDHPKFKNKFVMVNHYKNDDDKIEYMILEELKGEVDNKPLVKNQNEIKMPTPNDTNEIEF